MRGRQVKPCHVRIWRRTEVSCTELVATQWVAQHTHACWPSRAGFTGADLQNLMNEAAILAARRSLKEISKEEISDALERIVAGPEKKGAVMTEQKKRLVAYHEV